MSSGQALVEPSLRLASFQTPLQHVPVPRISVSRLLAFLFPRQLGTGTGRLPTIFYSDEQVICECHKKTSGDRKIN